MDKYERRRLLLIKIRDDLCDGNVAELARKLEKVDNYVHRMLYPVGKKGKKRIGEDSVDMVREKFGINLDAQDEPRLRIAASSEDRNLQWLSADEAAFLSQYRACAPPEKDAALSYVGSLPKVISDKRSDQG